MPANDKSSYVYTWTRPDTGEVFYVGMGRGARDVKLKVHNPHFMRVVEKLKRLGLEPVVTRIAEGLTRAEAASIEISEIARIGRAVVGGPLCNRTSGGEGAFEPDPEVIERRTKSLREAWSNPETRSAWLEALNSPEFREKQQAAWACPAKREARLSAMRKSSALPEVRAKKSEFRTSFWKSERGRATMHEANNRPEVLEQKRQAALKYNSDPAVIAKKSADQTRRYSDPEERKRTADALRARLKDPETREIWRAAQRMAPPRSDNKTGYKGVCYDVSRNKYVANICDGGKTQYLGRFDEAQTAARAYDTAAVAMWGLGNCYLNFPQIYVTNTADNDNILTDEAVVAA